MASLKCSRILVKFGKLSDSFFSSTSSKYISGYNHASGCSSRWFSSNEVKRKLKKKAEAKLPDVEGMNREFKQFQGEIGGNVRNMLGSPSNYTFRTHTCGELTAENVGQTVTLCGWLTFKRMKGAFVVLRDLYGVTQLYVPREVCCFAVTGS